MSFAPCWEECSPPEIPGCPPRCAVASLPQNLSRRVRAPRAARRAAMVRTSAPLHPTHRGAEACRGRSAVGAAQLQLLPHRAASLHLHGDLPALDTALDVPREEAWVRSPPPHTHGLAPGVSQSAWVPAAVRRLFGLVYKASVIGAPCTHTPGSTDIASEQRARARRRHKVKPVRVLRLCADGVHRPLLLRPQRRRCAASGALPLRWRGGVVVPHPTKTLPRRMVHSGAVGQGCALR